MPPITALPPTISSPGAANTGTKLEFRTGKCTPQPPRAVIAAIEGWGKTTIASQIPGAVILMSRGETGYETLLASDLVPEIPRVTVEAWPDLLNLIQRLSRDPGDIKTVVLDTLGGFERLCHEYVCARDFSNNWGEHGFSSFQTGYTVSLQEWIKLLKFLDDLHQKGIGILILSHVIIHPFENPEGPRFDRYIPACHRKTADITYRWADTILFGNFVQALTKEKGEQRQHGLRHGGRDRVLYTTRSDAYDAKNRYGMPLQINMPSDYSQAWQALAQHIPYYRTEDPAPPAAPTAEPKTAAPRTKATVAAPPPTK